MEELKIHSSSLHNLAFDKNSNMPDDLRSQINHQNTMIPIENLVDYLDRAFKRQLELHFGVIDNPYTKFY